MQSLFLTLELEEISENPMEATEILTLSEEEIFNDIFTLKSEGKEKIDDLNPDQLYYLNDSFPKKNNKKSEEVFDTVLLIDDFNIAFKMLESNSTNNVPKNNILSNIKHFDCHRDDIVNIPCFIENDIREKKCFSIIQNDQKEIINQKMPKNKKEKSKTEFKIKRKKNNKKKDNYKFEEEISKDDKCFPFIAGNKFNRLNIGYSISQLNTNINSNLNNSTYDISFNEEDNLIDNEETDYCYLKFKTKKYYISSEGKKKRIKKIRKYKPDDIRKKIKVRFHKTLKNIINSNLKKVNSKELFDFIPQSFIGNISKKLNFNALNFTYKELLSINFNQNKIDNKKYLKNQKVLKYLEENPEISKKSGFDIIQNMKYKDLLQLYFNSSEFEDAIELLKNEQESIEYIDEYIYRAKTFIRFYSNYINQE